MKNKFAKLGTYFKFLCKREKINSVVWIICITGISVMIAALYPNLLPTHEELFAMASTMANPAMVAMMGPVYGMDNLTQASVMTQECFIWFLITIAIMNIFLVNRHTRTDEEFGRLEMFGAMPVGKLTCSTAVIKFSFCVNFITSVLIAIFIYILNINGTTIEGALIYGFSIGIVGILFASLTLFAAQIFSTAHAVSGFGFFAIILFYIMRAAGDVSDNALSYISPLGLALKTEPFYTNDIVPIIIIFIESIVLTAAAIIICYYRDHGAGIIPAKKGRSNASIFLKTPLGYAWRLSASSSISWALGIFLLGASYGSVCGDIESFVEKNEMMKQIIGSSATTTLTENYIAMIFSIMSLVISVPIIITAMRIYNEEKRGRLEQIYGKAVKRSKLYGCFILISIAESIVFILMMILGLYSASGNAIILSEAMSAGFNYLPAVWVMIGLAVLIVGIIPKLNIIVWLMFGYTFFIMYFGRIFDTPEWVTRITPFGNIPQLPIQEFNILPLIILTAVSIVFIVTGTLFYTKRDIT